MAPPARLLVAATAFLVLGLGVSAGCRSPKRPPPPAPTDETALRLSDPRELGPYLEAFPLGTEGTRMDLLAADKHRSMHLVQTRRVIPAHYHPAATERAYVLHGEGTVYVGDRSYPALPGSTFRIEPGVVHAIHPEAGATLVAIVYYEPPQTEGVERVLAD